MSSDLPPQIVRAIAFVGRQSGSIKTLSGFRKSAHSIPDAANAATNAFLAKICSTELADEAERIFQAARTQLGYKRKEIGLNTAPATATITAKDFNLEISYSINDQRPSEYITTTTLRELLDIDVARADSFRSVFAARFSEIEFAFEKRASVEAVIDAIEGLEGDGGVSVDFPSNYESCTVSVAAVDAVVRCTPGALEVIFARRGDPAELIDGFMAIRDAFQISPVLGALIVR